MRLTFSWGTDSSWGKKKFHTACSKWGKMPWRKRSRHQPCSRFLLCFLFGNLVCFKSDAGKYEYVFTVRNSYNTGIVWRASRESVCQHPVPTCSLPQKIGVHSSRLFSLNLYQYPFTHSCLGFSSNTHVIILNISLLLFFPQQYFEDLLFMSEHTTHPVLWSAAEDFRGGMSVMDSTTSAWRDLPSVSSLLRSQMLPQGESLGVSWWVGESILVGWRLRRGITRFEKGNCIFDTRCKTVLQTDCLDFLLCPEGLFAQPPTQSAPLPSPWAHLPTNLCSS